MSKELEALEEAKNRKGLPIGVSFAPITESELNVVETALKALEIIKELFDIKIDLKELPESCFLSIYEKDNNKYIYFSTISRDKAKLLKEYFK